MQTLLQYITENFTSLLLFSVVASIVLFIILIPSSLVIAVIISLGIRLFYCLCYMLLLLVHMLSLIYLKINRNGKWTTLFDLDLTGFKDKLWKLSSNKSYLYRLVVRRKLATVLLFIVLFTFAQAALYTNEELAPTVVEYLDKANESIAALVNKDAADTAEQSFIAYYIRLADQDNLTQANVRAEPSLNGNEIGVAVKGKHYKYLNEEVKDGDRIWYKIQFDFDKVGWISSAISEKFEVKESYRIEPKGGTGSK